MYVARAVALVLLLGVFVAFGMKYERHQHAPYIHALEAQATKSHCTGEVTYPTMVGE
jgi:hypothetical protein